MVPVTNVAGSPNIATCRCGDTNALVAVLNAVIKFDTKNRDMLKKTCAWLLLLHVIRDAQSRLPQDK